MTEIDFSDPAHRLDNWAKGVMFKAYARLRHQIHSDLMDSGDAAFLQGVCQGLESGIAHDLGITQSTLVGRLTDIGDEFWSRKTAKDSGGSATG